MSPDSLPYGSSLPGHWTVSPLKYLVTLTNGFAFKADSWSDDGVPIIRIENLNGSQSFHHTQSNPGCRYLARSGDLLFAWSGNPGTSFGPFRWHHPEICLVNQHIFKVSVHGVDQNWLYWALRAATPWIERELTSGMIGMVHVTKGELGGVPIPIPPLEEQRRIAEYLDGETSRIDTLSSFRSAQLGLLAERDKTARDTVLTAVRDKYGTVPLRRMLLKIEQGVSPQCDNVPRESEEWGVLKLSAVKRGEFLAEENKRLPSEITPERRFRLRSGDLLVTRANTPQLVGDAAVVSGNVGNLLLPDLIYRIKMLPEWDARFVKHVILSTAVRGLVEADARGSSQSMVKLRGEDIKAWPMPCVPWPQQPSIADEIDRHLAATARIRSSLLEQRSLLAERRQTLITAAVTGQFDVSTSRLTALEN